MITIDINKKMRILVTGITSIHGWPIFKEIEKYFSDAAVLGICPPKMKKIHAENILHSCISDRPFFERIKKDFNPTHVIHCAGVCDLDVCEVRPDWAYDLNAGGSETIVSVFSPDAYIIYISNDLVFSGHNPPSGGYTENSKTDPVSVVGKTFVEAEEMIKEASKYAILRVGLPLGDSVTKTKGAYDWIESRLRKGLKVTLFYDECRSCIACDSLGKGVRIFLENEIEGLFHFGADKTISIFDIGDHILKHNDYDKTLLKGISLKEEKKGPPRIGNVTMNSEKILKLFKSMGIDTSFISSYI